MLDSIYHMTKMAFWHENVKILPSFTQCYNRHHYMYFILINL